MMDSIPRSHLRSGGDWLELSWRNQLLHDGDVAVGIVAGDDAGGDDDDGDWLLSQLVVRYDVATEPNGNRQTKNNFPSVCPEDV